MTRFTLKPNSAFSNRLDMETVDLVQATVVVGTADKQPVVTVQDTLDLLAVDMVDKGAVDMEVAGVTAATVQVDTGVTAQVDMVDMVA